MIGNVAAVTLAQWFTVSALREVSTPKTNGPQVNVLACTTYKPYFQGQSVLHALKPLLMRECLSKSESGGKVQSSNWDPKAVIRLYQMYTKGLHWLLISSCTASFKLTNKLGVLLPLHVSAISLQSSSEAADGCDVWSIWLWPDFCSVPVYDMVVSLAMIWYGWLECFLVCLFFFCPCELSCCLLLTLFLGFFVSLRQKCFPFLLHMFFCMIYRFDRIWDYISGSVLFCLPDAPEAVLCEV